MAKKFQVDTGGTLTTGQVSYYQEEDSTDYLGNNNGTDTSITYNTSNGKVNQGAGLNGSSSKIKATVSSGLSGSFSLNFWVNPTSNSARFTCLESWQAAASNYWASVHIQNGTTPNIEGALWDGTHNPAIADSVALPLNTWTMITFIRNTSDGKIHLYKNGTGIGTGVVDTTTSVPVYSDFFVGVHQAASGTFSEFLGGAMDEVGIWSKVLSAQEMTDLYNAGAGQTMITSASVAPNMLLVF